MDPRRQHLPHAPTSMTEDLSADRLVGMGGRLLKVVRHSVFRNATMLFIVSMLNYVMPLMLVPCLARAGRRTLRCLRLRNVHLPAEDEPHRLRISNQANGGDGAARNRRVREVRALARPCSIAMMSGRRTSSLR
jgi:hypothetical protein